VIGAGKCVNHYFLEQLKTFVNIGADNGEWGIHHIRDFHVQVVLKLQFYNVDVRINTRERKRPALTTCEGSHTNNKTRTVLIAGD
jgi:hypothetical protein